jgi:predicted peroxiredoxin
MSEFTANLIENAHAQTQQELHIVVVSNDPTRVYPAVTLALGSIAMGAKANLYFTMLGLDAIRTDASERIKFQGLPPIDKYIKDAIQGGAKVTACAPSREMLAQFGVTESTVLPGVELEDVVGFLSNALPAAKSGGVVLFV